jgi:hypothetical protein
MQNKNIFLFQIAFRKPVFPHIGKDSEMFRCRSKAIGKKNKLKKQHQTN